MRRKIEPIIRILSNITKQPNGCWDYTGFINKKGYGRINLGKDKYVLCHRVVYAHFKGTIGSLFVCHTCDNRRCCNPDHLFLGTNQENIQDMNQKGRNYISWGERSGLHKLSTEEVKAIRSDSRLGIQIAQDFGVTKSTVSEIKNYKSRKYE